MNNSQIAKAKIKNTILELIVGDITQQDVDVIVNAANSSLLGGGGVDGAIHRAAGPELIKETRQLDGCKTGEAKISKGYRLPASYVIHAVGPIYQRNSVEVPQLLASAYRRSLEIAIEYQLKTIALPAISTGVYGYPIEKAAPIALETTTRVAKETDSLHLVRFVLFTRDIFAQFNQALIKLASNHAEVVLNA